MLADLAGVVRGEAVPAGAIVEELEIAAEVEHEEVLLVLTWPEQVWTQPRAAAEHLPELRLRPDGLGEHQIDDLGDVDAGVEHVHADRDVRCLVLLLERLYQ